MSEFTRILAEVQQGDLKTADESLPLAYNELRKLAKAPFSQKNPERIRDRKKIYHLDIDSRASHRLRETPPPRESKAKP